ncbi:MAG: pilus assembly protein N-terminal domain-containing protein [bacterium]|nr:pilus assembly protein N-terminal domain-containing protein [bacterium]
MFVRHDVLRCLMILVIVGLVSQLYAEETIQLVVGQDKIIGVNSPERIALGSNIAAVKKLSDTQILVTAKEVGLTTLTVWNKNGEKNEYTINIIKTDPTIIAKEIQQLLEDVDDIHVNVVGTNVVIEGKLGTDAEIVRLLKVLRAYPSVLNLAEIDPRLKQTIAKIIKEEIGFKDVNVKVVGERILLEGVVPTEEDIKYTEKIASIYYSNIDNLLKVGGRMIEVYVRIIEVDRDKLKDIKPLNTIWTAAIESNGEITGKKNPGPPYELSFNASVNMPPIIDRWITDGYATLLAKPKLVVASGHEAEFRSGGEIPIVTVTAFTTNVEFKKYGVNLKIKPVVDREDNIVTHLFTEVSSIDWSNKVGAVPAILTRSAETDVCLKKGESIIIAGLIHKINASFVKRVPILGYIPILSLFYSSKDIRSKETEVIIVVTPKIAQHYVGEYPRINSEFGEQELKDLKVPQSSGDK